MLVRRRTDGIHTGNSNVGRTADGDLSTQPVHRSTPVRRILITGFQVMDEQIPRGQLVELAICNKTKQIGEKCNSGQRC